MTTIADYLDRHVENKAARKLIKNWFEKGRIGKDLVKGKTYVGLLKLYR